MRIVSFYREEIPNQNGAFLKDIMKFSHGAMEMDHDYVQWLFPSNERSMLNGEAPTLTKEESEVFQNDPVLKEKVRQAFYKFLDFLALHIDPTLDVISPKETENLPWWLRSFNHNMLRITRCLKCLRLTGNTDLAVKLFNYLRTVSDKVSVNTMSYWRHATNENLW